MHRKYAKMFGIIFMAIGVLGFIPGLTMHGDLFGIFHVNTLNNVVHFATGLIAYWTSQTSMRAAVLFFQVFGIIYVAIGLLGLVYGNRDIFRALANNKADTWLHLITGLFFSYCGFLYKGK